MGIDNLGDALDYALKGAGQFFSGFAGLADANNRHAAIMATQQFQRDVGNFMAKMPKDKPEEWQAQFETFKSQYDAQVGQTLSPDAYRSFQEMSGEIYNHYYNSVRGQSVILSQANAVNNFIKAVNDNIDFQFGDGQFDIEQGLTRAGESVDLAMDVAGGLISQPNAVGQAGRQNDFFGLSAENDKVNQRNAYAEKIKAEQSDLADKKSKLVEYLARQGEGMSSSPDYKKAQEELAKVEDTYKFNTEWLTAYQQELDSVPTVQGSGESSVNEPVSQNNMSNQYDAKTKTDVPNKKYAPEPQTRINATQQERESLKASLRDRALLNMTKKSLQAILDPSSGLRQFSPEQIQTWIESNPTGASKEGKEAALSALKEFQSQIFEDKKIGYSQEFMGLSNQFNDFWKAYRTNQGDQNLGGADMIVEKLQQFVSKVNDDYSKGWMDEKTYNYYRDEASEWARLLNAKDDKYNSSFGFDPSDPNIIKLLNSAVTQWTLPVNKTARSLSSVTALINDMIPKLRDKNGKPYTDEGKQALFQAVISKLADKDIIWEKSQEFSVGRDILESAKKNGIIKPEMENMIIDKAFGALKWQITNGGKSLKGFVLTPEQVQATVKAVIANETLNFDVYSNDPLQSKGNGHSTILTETSEKDSLQRLLEKGSEIKVEKFNSDGGWTHDFERASAVILKATTTGTAPDPNSFNQKYKTNYNALLQKLATGIQTASDTKTPLDPVWENGRIYWYDTANPKVRFEAIPSKMAQSIDIIKKVKDDKGNWVPDYKFKPKLVGDLK